MNDNEKAVVTDLTEIKKKEKRRIEREINETALEIALNLIEMAKRGLTAEEILKILLNGIKVLSIKEIEIYRQIVDKSIIYAKQDELYKNNRELYNTLLDLQTAVKDYYDKLVEAQKFSYKGKDGKDYSDRTTVDIMDGDYKNQLYTENQSKHM